MPTRLVILADVHLPAPGSAPTAGPLAELFRRAIEKAQELNPAAIILLGDTIETGIATEYAAARRIVSPVRSLIRPLPGNHEFLKGTPADFRAGWNTEPFAADLLENIPVMRFNSGLEGQSEDEYFGRISIEQLRVLDALIDARSSGPALVFSHHPLRDTVSRTNEPNFAIENSAELRTRLLSHRGRSILFSGHTHYQSVIHDGRLSCIGCPPLGFWPHAFLTVEIDESVLRYRTTRLIDDPEDSPDPEAQDARHRARAEGSALDREGAIQLRDEIA